MHFRNMVTRNAKPGIYSGGKRRRYKFPFRHTRRYPHSEPARSHNSEVETDTCIYEVWKQVAQIINGVRLRDFHQHNKRKTLLTRNKRALTA